MVRHVSAVSSEEQTPLDDINGRDKKFPFLNRKETITELELKDEQIRIIDLKNKIPIETAVCHAKAFDLLFDGGHDIQIADKYNNSFND